MANIRIWLRYDGTDFHGYQIQKNGYTIQQALKEAVRDTVGEECKIIGCSRTDAGVHAEMYCANFHSDTKIPPQNLPLALNTHLPLSVRVYAADYVEESFHATFSTIEKTYEYTIDTALISNPFTSRYSWHYPYKVDVDKMKIGAKAIIGTHDFTAFMASGGQAKTAVRTVKELEIFSDNNKITIKITADGFLYNMVRIIAGTLIYCGIGKIDPNSVDGIINSRDRKAAGITAPPQGLKLVSVVY